MRNTGPNKCNQSGWFDHVTDASLPTIRLGLLFVDKCAVFVANYRGLDRYYNLIFAGRKISREENFAGGKFRGRKISRNSIRSGYYFRGRKISRKIQIREYSENFLHAKNWCYTVFNSATFLPMLIPLKTLRNFSNLHLKIYSG